MNLLPLVARRDGAVIAGTDGPAVLPAQFADGMLGVRPEHIRVQRDGGHTARVESVEYLGGDSLIACRLGETSIAVRQSGRSRVGRRRCDPPGMGRRRAALFRCIGSAHPRARATRGDDARLERRGH